MATQSVEFGAPPNQTLTVRLFSAGSDTIVATAGTVTAATNRAGIYTAAFTDVAAGRYKLIATNAAGTPLANWWADLTLTTATFQTYEMPLSAITADVYAALPADHTVNGSYGARIILALNSNRVAQLTGSNHIAADVHEFQENVLTEAAIADNAITAAQISADAVAEIQSGLATDTELAKVPKSGETRRYTQVASNTGNKTADVSIGAPI
jgi:hypothetical protein